VSKGVRGVCAKNSAWLNMEPHNPKRSNIAITRHL
ncbi:hypothetical protein EVA_19855, partial [gut metagenome]